jgi:hypothetical protein
VQCYSVKGTIKLTVSIPKAKENKRSIVTGVMYGVNRLVVRLKIGFISKV